MAAEPASPHPRYTALWIPPEGALSKQVEIYAGDDENEAIVQAAQYDAPVVGRVEIRHCTPAGTQVGVRIVERDEQGAQIISSFDGGEIASAKVEPRRQNEETAEPDRVEPVEEPETSEEEDEEQTSRELADAAEELEHDFDAHEAAEAAQAAQAEAHAAGELFDSQEYEKEGLQIAKVDGRGIDKIRVAFNGSIMLDRSNVDHVALFNRLTLGKSVQLRVAGEVTKTGVGWTTNKDGDLDAIVGERGVKVTTVYMLDPEEL